MEDDDVIGEIRLFAGDFAPANWKICDGASLPISIYQELYSLIGNIWGGDATSFRLPDLRGRVPIGQGQGVGLTLRQVGQAGGDPEVTADTPSHSHTFFASKADADLTDPTQALLAVPKTSGTVTGLYLKVDGTKYTLADDTVGYSGSHAQHNNYMPSFALTYIICFRGLYPDRS